MKRDILYIFLLIYFYTTIPHTKLTSSVSKTYRDAFVQDFPGMAIYPLYKEIIGVWSKGFSSYECLEQMILEV